MIKFQLLALLFFPLAMLAQTDELSEPDAPSEEYVFTFTEVMPEYPGGQDSLIQFLVDNIIYPSAALEAGIQGKVYAQFTVTKTGDISDIVVLRGIGGGCDEETARVLALMPNWKPGTQRGKPVHVRFTMPVKFSHPGLKK